MSGTGSTGMTQTSVTIHDCSGSGCAPVNTTTYFHDDQIGSARLLSAGYGYPVWQGTFTPFGQEVSPVLTSNHFKFNGKERGEASEGGLDYFGARYYSSVIGRWMTPDWSDTPSTVPYAKLTDPQPLNLYSFVTDDPLSHTDVDGHFQSALANSSCGNNNGNTCQPVTSAEKCARGMTTFCQEAADSTLQAGGNHYPAGGRIVGNQFQITYTAPTQYERDQDGNIIGSVTITITASFQMGTGQFLGAEMIRDAATIKNDPILGGYNSEKASSTSEIGYQGAARVFGGRAILDAASYARSNNQCFFCQRLKQDVAKHPFRAIGRAIFIGGLIAFPPTTGPGAALAVGAAASDLGESVQHAGEEQ
jgi:RHS repeat-associated protein